MTEAFEQKVIFQKSRLVLEAFSSLCWSKFCYFFPFLPIFYRRDLYKNDLLWVFWHEVKTENNRGQWERHFFCSFKESEQEGIYCAGLSPLNTIARFISDIFLEFLLFAHFSNFEKHVIWYRKVEFKIGYFTINGFSYPCIID